MRDSTSAKQAEKNINNMEAVYWNSEDSLEIMSTYHSRIILHWKLLYYEVTSQFVTQDSRLKSDKRKAESKFLLLERRWAKRESEGGKGRGKISHRRMYEIT